MEPALAIVHTAEDGRRTVHAPRLGVFSTRVVRGAVVTGGAELGTLRVLERRVRVTLPGEGVFVVAEAPPREAPTEYGAALFTLTPLDATQAAGLGGAAGVGAGAAGSAEAGDRLAVRAPIHGVFYRRAAPGAPAYVEVGGTLEEGQTIGLVEVMKTFNPVTFKGVVARAVVVAIAAEDRQEVGHGDVLLWVRPS
jgi:acetyl-CoA carboxylase biotin carboxyl carrier protein